MHHLDTKPLKYNLGTCKKLRIILHWLTKLCFLNRHFPTRAFIGNVLGLIYRTNARPSFSRYLEFLTQETSSKCVLEAQVMEVASRDIKYTKYDSQYHQFLPISVCKQLIHPPILQYIVYDTQFHLLFGFYIVLSFFPKYLIFYQQRSN